MQLLTYFHSAFSDNLITNLETRTHHANFPFKENTFSFGFPMLWPSIILELKVIYDNSWTVTL